MAATHDDVARESSVVRGIASGVTIPRPSKISDRPRFAAKIPPRSALSGRALLGSAIASHRAERLSLVHSARPWRGRSVYFGVTDGCCPRTFWATARRAGLLHHGHRMVGAGGSAPPSFGYQPNALLLSYAPLDGTTGVAPALRPWHGRGLLLPHVPVNFWLRQVDSNHHSELQRLAAYRLADASMVPAGGIEPLSPPRTPALQAGDHPTGRVLAWWSRPDLPRPPPACKAGALLDELRPRIFGGPSRGRTGASWLRTRRSPVDPMGPW